MGTDEPLRRAQAVNIYFRSAAGNRVWRGGAAVREGRSWRFHGDAGRSLERTRRVWRCPRRRSPHGSAKRSGPAAV